MIKGSDYNEQLISPNQTVFYLRPYRLREELPALKILVTDYSYSATKDAENQAYRGQRGGATAAVGTGEDEFSIELTSPEAVSVDGVEMYHALMKSGEQVEIWEVNSDIESDGMTVTDNKGEVVPKGWVKDWYGVGIISEFEHENNSGDSTIADSITLTLNTAMDQSWVEPIKFEEEITAQYPNASLKKYTKEDNPKNTVRNKFADEVTEEIDKTQTADVANDSSSESNSESNSESVSISDSASNSESHSESQSISDSQSVENSKTTRKRSK